MDGSPSNFSADVESDGQLVGNSNSLPFPHW